MKLYLVWNEAKTECVGFVDKNEADYAAGLPYWEMQPSPIADAWFAEYGYNKCTIQEIEV